MIALDKNFIRAFSPNEQLVMLRLLLEADGNGMAEYNAEKMENGTGLSREVLSGVCHKLLNEGVIAVQDKKIVICDFEGYRYGKKKTVKNLPSVPIEERVKDFYNTLIPYLDSRGGQFPKEMIRDFFNYWSEPNKSNTKMRFELQKTWEVGRRLKTWADNNKYTNRYKSRDEQRIEEAQRRKDDAYALMQQLAAEDGIEL